MKEYSFFGDGAKFHHLGLAVESIRQICDDCEITVEKTQKVSLAFIRFNGICLELLEPSGEDSPILRGMRSGNKLLHLCFEVPDLDEAIERCRPAGFHRLGPPVTTPVFDGRRLAWVFSREFGLFELAEM
ncbi:MAG: VOC family protein [Acidobacteria bacterium]|nr:VOC family protein [Acidobacteriota bacterium]